MLRVTRSKPCPICGRIDWCGMSDDGAIAVCMREQSPRPTKNGGWLHKLADAPARHFRTARVAVRGTGPDLTARAAEYAARATDAMVADLAQSLDVSIEALRRLGVGWTGRAWAFPMRRDIGGAVCGIRLRFSDGSKLSAKGGREGLFIPDDLSGNRGLIVAEGPTDTAALLTLGFEAIGRPSCSGAVKLLTDVCRGREVAIIADGDKPGLRGAGTLATALHLVCPSVRFCMPPKPHKDCRAWVQGGATRETVMTLIGKAVPCGVVRVVPK